MTCCCSTTEWPDGFTPPVYPLTTTTNASAIRDLTLQIQENKKLYDKLPAVYQSCPLVRVIICALTIIGVAVAVMALQGTLTSFPQNFIHFIHTINWTYVGAGAALLTALTLGAAIVIHSTLHEIDKITKHDIGALTGDDHWVPAIYHGMKGSFKGYIDQSTKSSGKAFMYAHKEAQEHYIVSLEVFGLTPLHMVGAIVYNILRLVVIPFYILGRMARDQIFGPPEKPEERYRLSDIPDELCKTLRRIVRASSCALAVMYASLYSLIDPLNGRKLGSYLERYWNEGVTRAEGFWSVRGGQTLWEYEGEGVRGQLGKNGYYLAGCWQPIAVVYYDENGEMLEEGSSLTHAICKARGDPYIRGEAYTIVTAEILTKKHELLLDELGKLSPTT
jgi:hypothetical protein